jgi:hypothetical protein
MIESINYYFWRRPDGRNLCFTHAVQAVMRGERVDLRITEGGEYTGLGDGTTAYGCDDCHGLPDEERSGE